MLITLLATAVVLGVLIFVHELGHFVTAKLVDIEVPRFSIGFGPKVVGFRRGETEYVISLLPLGGYVKMAGMEELETIEGSGGGDQEQADGGVRTPGPRDFESKSLAARTLVISAGVIMNVIFAFLVYSFIGIAWGIPAVPPSVVGGITEEYLPAGTEALSQVPPGARITAIGNEDVENFEDLRLAITTARAGETEVRFANHTPVRIAIPEADTSRAKLMAAIDPESSAPPVFQSVIDTLPAGRAGLRAGDRVVAAGGEPVDTWQRFVAIVEASPGRPIPVTVERDGQRVEVMITPATERLGSTGQSYGRIGVSGTAVQLAAQRHRVGPVQAIVYGATETLGMIRLTVDFLVGIFSGRLSPRNVGGPIMIGQISGQVARAGLETFLSFMALLSVNLAVLNLLPIPVLDGGQLLFLGIEAVRGRALSLKQRIRLSQVGLVLILAIMVFAIGNDLMRWMGF